jgi:hypothetical protein
MDIKNLGKKTWAGGENIKTAFANALSNKDAGGDGVGVVNPNPSVVVNDGGIKGPKMLSKTAQKLVIPPFKKKE